MCIQGKCVSCFAECYVYLVYNDQVFHILDDEFFLTIIEVSIIIQIEGENYASFYCIYFI